MNIESKIKNDKFKLLPFYEKLKKQDDKISIIGEIKKASPSLGKFLKEDIDVADIAKVYEKNNISCLSVLTDEKYFMGSIEDLIKIKKKPLSQSSEKILLLMNIKYMKANYMV